MEKKNFFTRIYFGWWICIVNALLGGLAGGFRNQGFSALFKPIAEELDLTRAGASVASGISTIQNGIIFALAGWLSDRFGPKWVIIPGSCVMGLGLALMYFVNSALRYYIVWGIIMTSGASFAFSVSQDKMLTDWFISKRGLALGVRFAILGVVASLVLPAISWLILKLGWRLTCLLWGGVIFCGLPIMFIFVPRRRPEYYGLLPDGAELKSDPDSASDDIVEKGIEYAVGLQETEFTLKEAMLTPTYWFLTGAWVVHGIIFRGVSVHCIPFLTDIGIDPVTAGGLMGMMVMFTIPSRFFGGIIADRFQKEQLKFLLTASFSLNAIGIMSLFLCESMLRVYVLLILLGLGTGSFIPMDIVIRGRYFGRKAYGSIQGSTAILTVPITFFSPIFTGWIYDTTGDYMNAFLIFGILAFACAVMMLLIRPPRPPSGEK